MVLANQPIRKRPEFASHPFGKGMMFRNMGIGEQGAKARNFDEFAPFLRKSGSASAAPSDRYPLSHFKEFCAKNSLVEDPDFAEFVRNNYLGGTRPEPVLPEKTKLMVRRTVERFSDSEVVMVREAEGDLGHGEGVFTSKTCFLSGTFEDKCAALEDAIISVYMSWFSEDGAAHRKKHGSRGMGIMVEAIVGEKIDIDGKFYLLPHFSGVGYTDYDGQGILARAVRGLGTLAVDGGGVLFTEHDCADAIRGLEQDEAAAISLSTGRIVMIPCSKLPFPDMDLSNVIVFLEDLKERGEYYVEWSYLPGKEGYGTIFVNQVCEIKEGEKNILAPRAGDWTLLSQGMDCLGEGGKECNGIVAVANYWNVELKNLIGYVGRYLKDYLLIVPRAAISDASSQDKLTKAGIINCSAVQENASSLSHDDHLALIRAGQKVASLHGTKAATHFEGICKDENINFLSAPMQFSLLFESGGQMAIHPWAEAGCVMVFNAAARMERVPASRAMQLHLNTEKMPIDLYTWNLLLERFKAEDNSSRLPEKSAGFTHVQLENITMKIRRVASRNEITSPENARLLYKVHNAIVDISVDMPPDIYALPDQKVSPEEKYKFTRADIERAISLINPDQECMDAGAVDYLKLVLEKMG